jgi:hypothetical protein
VLQISQKLAVLERRACKVLEQARATQRRNLSPPYDEKQLTNDIIALATRYGRYVYRRITALLNNEHGWRVNHKRVERIWSRKGRNLSQLPTYVKTPTEVSDQQILLDHPMVKLWEQIVPLLMQIHPEYEKCPQARHLYHENI